MKGGDICALSASELIAHLRDGDFSAQTVVDATLTQIDRYDPDYNAFTLVDREGARAAARAADRKRENNEPIGPLHGVPFSVKDVIQTQGLETAFGSHLLAGNIPERDATAVSRLKDAGAILLGKTTTPEFAHKAITDSPRHGVTRNPWNPKYSSGGSSGGAAVAAACGMGPLAITTDGAGSSRIPASCCGTLGLKATLGRIPNEDGADLFGAFSYIGAITRTSDDLALMLNTMSGETPGDPWSRAVSYEPAKLPDDPVAMLRGLRVHYKPFLGNRLLDNDISASMELMLDLLSINGANVTRSDGHEDWGNEMARACIRGLMAGRMSRYSAAERERMDPSLRTSIAEGESIDAQTMKEVPLLRSALYRQTEEIFRDADLLITPCLAAPPPRADHSAHDPITINGENAGPLREAWYNYPAPFNLTGHPAISIPAGRNREGLPIGLQAVAPWYGEQRLIDLAAAIECLQPWEPAPALLGG